MRQTLIYPEDLSLVNASVINLDIEMPISGVFTAHSVDQECVVQRVNISEEKSLERKMTAPIEIFHTNSRIALWRITEINL